MNIPMSDAINELAAALVKAQSELTVAVKDSNNPHLKSRYADLGSVWAAARGPLAANGLAVVQVGGVDGTGKPVLRTILVHKSGQWIAGDLPLEVRENKGTSIMQALGSAVTYARRYGLQAAVGIVADDDDGNAAGGAAPSQAPAKAASSNDNGNGHANGSPNGKGSEPQQPLITKKQVEELAAICKQKGKSVEVLCKRFNVDSLAKLTLGQYGIAKAGFAKMPDARQEQDDEGVEV